MGEAPPLLPGRRPEDILEAGGDPYWNRAFALVQLASELEGVIYEFKYDDFEKHPLSEQLVKRAEDLAGFLESVYLNTEVQLTPDHICSACGGSGERHSGDGEEVLDCGECEGDGIEKEE